MPTNLVVCHDPIICNHPWCINPKHLRLGTKKNNSDDMDLIGTRTKFPDSHGELNTQAKLKEKDILVICKLSKILSQPKIARIFNVSQPCINLICKNINWKYINRNTPLTIEQHQLIKSILQKRV